MDSIVKILNNKFKLNLDIKNKFKIICFEKNHRKEEDDIEKIMIDLENQIGYLKTINEKISKLNDLNDNLIDTL
jgi:hypothetical protein